MAITPEDRARQNIDKLLDAGGWMLQDRRAVNITAGRGVAVREFPMKKGHGEADYLQPMERKKRAKPIESNVPLWQKVVDIRKSYEQTIDTITKDELLSVGADDAAKEKEQEILRGLNEEYERTFPGLRYVCVAWTPGVDCTYCKQGVCEWEITACDFRRYAAAD